MVSSASQTVEDHWVCLPIRAEWPFRRHSGDLSARRACFPPIVRYRIGYVSGSPGAEKAQPRPPAHPVT